MNEKTTAFLFGIHMHQPVDNFGEVIERAVAECYGPFFDVAVRYPEFRFSVHCSGWLLEEIRRGYPKLFSQMQELAQKGTIELFGAGYYEPILSAIPSQDRRAQIGLLSDTIERHFGNRPRGMWLTERVWEASLIPDIHAAGVRYTVMDDYHFLCTGFDEARLDGYYMTEEGGTPLALFPISKKLRYATPFLPVNQALEAIKSYSRKHDSAAIIFDDAEKFGMWPNTHAWVYEQGWLESFIEAVLDDPAVTPMRFGDYVEKCRPRGIAYLPNVSYYEMGEWSLGAADAATLESLIEQIGQERFEAEGVKFLKGGIWKNFLVKYEESNRIHKRMLELSSLRSKIDNPEFSDSLYRLQTNDVLWHGVFGGLYLPNLRDNAYRYLIECERIRHGGQNTIISHNPEMHAYPKALCVTEDLILRFDAQNGAQMIEFDTVSEGFNWQNSLTRRREAYHEKLLRDSNAGSEKSPQDGIDTIHTIAHRADESLRDAMVYDWYTKNSFIDHISDASFTLEHFRHCSFNELGDFANQPFEMRIENESVTFERSGGLFLPDRHPAHFVKRFRPKAAGFAYAIEMQSPFEGLFNYVLECNLHFAKPEHVTINGTIVSEGGTLEHLTQILLADAYTRKEIVISCDAPVTLHYVPLRTLSQSEKGFELTTQAISLALVLPFNKTLSLSGSVEVRNV